MTKYIDVELLKAEIERMREINRKALENGHITDDVFHGRAQTLNYLFEFINSFQQEQQEVNLEKVIDNYLDTIQAWQIQEAPFTTMEKCARHFYELGLKVGKEE